VTNRIYIFSTALLLAGCSSAAQEAPNTAIVTQGGPELSSAYDSMPPEGLLLDGAPSSDVSHEAPVIVVEQLRAPEPAPPATRVQSARLSCVIDVDRTANGIRITPVVKSGRSLAGEYSLVITKSGASGSSDISQGGPFAAARGERIELGSSEISLERGAKFRAVLKVRADGREICREISS
jgi:hypothetical protein